MSSGPSLEDQMKSLQSGHVMGDVDTGMASAPWSASIGDTGGANTIKSNAPKKGMLLGKKSKQPDPVMSELFGADAAEPAGAAAAPEEAPAAPVVNPLLDPV